MGVAWIAGRVPPHLDGSQQHATKLEGSLSLTKRMQEESQHSVFQGRRRHVASADGPSSLDWFAGAGGIANRTTNDVMQEARASLFFVYAYAFAMPDPFFVVALFDGCLALARVPLYR